MSDENSIIINLNNPKVMAYKKDNFTYRDKLEKVLKLIDERIKDIYNIENNFNTTSTKKYESSRMHDSILIDGKRGSGKTTFLVNLREEIDNNKSIKVLSAIDPNQLDKKSNILLIIIANIYTDLLDEMKRNHSDNKKSEYKRLLRMINELISAISASQERDYKDDYHKLLNLHKSLIIDETLHDFFTKVCNFFEVKILILPIDDVDMDFIHGYKVMDSIRKYLSTPKIIPIVSIDTSQLYSLVKKRHYTYFGYRASTPKDDIINENELNFLKTLPEEYIQKILMPTRKIVLPDIYELYRTHLDKKKPNILFSFDTNITDNKTLEFKIDMSLILKYYINIVYGQNIKDLDNQNEFNILNHLKDKSFRSFYEDIISFMNGFEAIKDEDIKYQYNIQNIKDRLTPMYFDHFDTKYDSTVWFWNKYLSILKKRIYDYTLEHKSKNSEYINDFYIDISKNLLFIDSFGDKKFIRNEQTYVRLYMQEFFIKDISIGSIKKEKKKIVKIDTIEKEIDISGIVELLTRAMLPIHIFEELINGQIIDIFKYNLTELKLFARDNNDTIRDSMFNLSISILKYYNENTFYQDKEDMEIIQEINTYELDKYCNCIQKKTNDNNESNKKIIGMFLEQKHKNIFGEYALIIERYSDLRKDKDIWFLSPLKFYSMLPNYFQSIRDNQSENLEKYIIDLSREYDYNMDNVYGFAYPLLKAKDIIFTIENSNLGVISIDNFSKDLVKNILQVSIREYSTDFIQRLQDSSEAQYRLFLDKHISVYKTLYLNHLVLFLVKKIDNNFFNNELKDLKSTYISHGTREKDFDYYKLEESFFASNIKIILKAIKETKKESIFKIKYIKIERFLYRLYLTMLKNYKYQSSYYIKKDKNFKIKKYIKRYIKEIKEDRRKEIEEEKKREPNKETKKEINITFNKREMNISKVEDSEKAQFEELKDLYDHLKSLYKEGKILSELNKEKKKKKHQKLIEEYKELYNNRNGNNSSIKDIMYQIAEEIEEIIPQDVNNKK